MYLLDASPLVTLATPVVDGKVIVEYILPLISIAVAETVAQEATINLAHRNAVVIKRLIDDEQIEVLPVPATSVDYLIDAYPKLGLDKGSGERDTIRLGIVTPNRRVIVDDQAAFFAAARFELNPITLQDLLVNLARLHRLEKSLAIKIVRALTGRYAAVSIQHTLHKLNEVRDDPTHN